MKTRWHLYCKNSPVLNICSGREVYVQLVQCSTSIASGGHLGGRSAVWHCEDIPTAEIPSSVGAHLSVPLKFLIIAGSPIQNIELYKEIQEPTDTGKAWNISWIKGGTQKSGTWWRRSTEDKQTPREKVPWEPTQLKVCKHFHTSESVLMKEWLKIPMKEWLKKKIPVDTE